MSRPWRASTATSPLRRDRLLALAALAALAYVIAVLITCHVVRQDVDPVMQPISAYGLGPGAGWFAAALVLWGASAWLLDAALRRRTCLEDVLLAVFGAGLVTAAVFPMDVPFPPGAWTIKAMSWVGIVHIMAASVSSIVFPFAALRLSSRVGAVRALKATAALSGIAAICVFGAPFVDVRFFGVAQRLLAAPILAWLVTAAVSLLRRPPR